MDTDMSMFRLEMAALTYGNEQKMASLLQECLYQQMESQSDMCDVTLVIGGVDIVRLDSLRYNCIMYNVQDTLVEHERKAHWCVLAVCPYFESVYKSDMKEKLAGKITLDFGDPSAIRAAIRFLYTGTVEITDKNIREILQASDYLQIERLKELCSKFLQFGSITVKNCIGLCVLGNLYNLEYVYNRALKFMNGHLAEVLEEDEALTLTADSVVDMITNVNLRYVSVEQFFGFLVKWVECDLLQRKEHFCDLFSHLNLSRVTKKFLTSEIERHSFVKNCVNCQTHITDHKEKLKSGENSQETEEKEVVLVMGGMRRDPLYGTQAVESVYAYIIAEDRWVQLPPLPRTVAKPQAASDGKQALYVVDAVRRFDHKQYVYKFVPGSKEWFELNVELPTNFSDPCVEQISCAGGKVLVMVSVYVISDENGRSEWSCHILELNEISRKFEDKCLLFTRGMNSQFKCCTTMGRYMCVCAWKLSNKSRGHSFAKFVYYDAEKDVLFDRSKGTFFQEVMYAKKNEIVLTRPGSKKARSFNLNTRKWRNRCREFALPPMKEEAERTDYCYCYHEGQLYVLGGKNSTSKHPVNSVLKFNIDKKQCDSMENLPEALIDPACCVMTLPTDLLRCHIDCPHCERLGRRQQAQYHRDSLTFSEDEDEDEYGYDDDDFNSDDDDDDMPYADHWDGIFFNSLDEDEFGGAGYYLY